ncbi:DUF4214 domain-containing protein [Baaleninema simplex]|uniref:DUF4214 domain-containing protein n=1 Tax=Baaleninema simplex TaxID=2862350 RepID=UPI00036AC104|nr:DUF4214 domain-containing protein [Baaleninema simplex]
MLTKWLLWSVATLGLIASSATPGRTQARCQQEEGFVLCLDRDWLRYYNQPYSEFDWQSYIRNRTPDQPSDYYDDIDRIYREVLGRAAEAADLQRWGDAIVSGTAVAQVRRAVADSEETQQRLNDIYRDLLGRNIDDRSLEIWRDKLTEGATLRDVYREIVTGEDTLIQ